MVPYAVVNVLAGRPEFCLATVNLMNAPKALEAWRKAAKMTQAQACGMIGVSAAAWSEWESGKKYPRTDRAEDIERLTGGAVTMSMWAAWERKRTSKARKSRMRVH
jgi:transcriptional regulator with XRE-family HTH domain